jgi:hypothetical protein
MKVLKKLLAAFTLIYLGCLIVSFVIDKESPAGPRGEADFAQHSM